MLIGEYCKKKRLERGFSEEEIANRIGSNFQASLLWDFEGGDDNDIDGWSIDGFKKYCEILEVEPEEVFSVVLSNLSGLNLNELLRSRREEKGISQEELSDIIGYDVLVVKSAENKDRDVAVCVDGLKELGKALDIPLGVLLRKC